MRGVIVRPIVVKDPSLFLQALVEGGAGIGREDRESGGFDPGVNPKLNRSLEDVGVIMIKPEYETAVDHDAPIVDAADIAVVVGNLIAVFMYFAQAFGADAFTADKQRSAA